MLRTDMRILFVHNGRERFVLDDLTLLTQSFDVTDWYQPKRYFNPLHLYQLLRTHDLVFCWFASWHSLAPLLLARRLGKPAVVVVGGYDTACLPEAGYGSQRGGLPKLIARTVIQQATHLITNSHSARQEAITNADAAPNKITVIYHGVEPLPMGDTQQREQIALTIGGVWHENLLRKGLLPFVQAAAYLPEVKFVHVGRWYDDSIDVLREAASPNVEFKGFVSDAELAIICSRASVYVQASLHEGFGLSVAEAMTAGCIPVVTRNGSLPEVVGEWGVYIDDVHPQTVAEGIKQAMLAPSARREKARRHILRQFPMEKRQLALCQLLESTR